MNANARTMQAEETKVGVRIKLSALWIAMMLLYIYADIFSLYRPGAIEDMMAGRMGPFPVTQASLLTASILMVIPLLVILIIIVVTRRLEDSKIGRAWADARVHRIYAGTNEIMKLLIARSL